MELNKIAADLQVLSRAEAQEIHAGETLWYWLFYGVGATVRFANAFLDGARYSYATMPGLK